MAVAITQLLVTTPTMTTDLIPLLRRIMSRLVPIKALEPQKKPKLRRALSLFHITMYGVGIILGAGIYALIGEAAGLAGNAIWLAFVIGAIIASFTGLSYAELGSMYPREAAEFVYSKKAFRSQRFSFLLGWLIISYRPYLFS